MHKSRMVWFMPLVIITAGVFPSVARAKVISATCTDEHFEALRLDIDTVVDVVQETRLKDLDKVTFAAGKKTKPGEEYFIGEEFNGKMEAEEQFVKITTNYITFGIEAFPDVPAKDNNGYQPYGDAPFIRYEGTLDRYTGFLGIMTKSKSGGAKTTMQYFRCMKLRPQAMF